MLDFSVPPAPPRSGWERRPAYSDPGSACWTSVRPLPSPSHDRGKRGPAYSVTPDQLTGLRYPPPQVRGQKGLACSTTPGQRAGLQYAPRPPTSGGTGARRTLRPRGRVLDCSIQPPPAKQEGNKMKRFLCNIWKKRSTQMSEVSIRSRHGAPSRKLYVVNGQMTKVGNE